MKYPRQELQAPCLPHGGLAFPLGGDPLGGSGNGDHPLGMTEVDHIPQGVQGSEPGLDESVIAQAGHHLLEVLVLLEREGEAGEVRGGVEEGDHPQREGEEEAVPALYEAWVVAPAAAELPEGLPVDGGRETFGAGPQPALKEDVDHMFVQLTPDGVVGLEGRG